MKTEFSFSFGNFRSRVLIREEPQPVREFTDSPALIVCDVNTEAFAREISSGKETPILALENGEKSKTWESVNKILKAALDAGLGRDGLFIGVGGGVVCDLASFAASIYTRGAALCLYSTTLLGIIDASIGGKTGIDAFGIKNLVGTFYPAGLAVLTLNVLDSLPEREWRSGMAELIKTAILGSGGFFKSTERLISLEDSGRNNTAYRECLKECISRAIAFKGGIVERDPFETKNERAILNLGHTFAHALEAATGLGVLSHGEAVAWGIARACELGTALGITPLGRAREISGLLSSYGYEIRAPHPLVKSHGVLMGFMKADKKQTNGKLHFIVPGKESAQIVSAENTHALEGARGEALINRIINGE